MMAPINRSILKTTRYEHHFCVEHKKDIRALFQVNRLKFLHFLSLIGRDKASCLKLKDQSK